MKTSEKVGHICDFCIRVIIMFTTVIALLYFAEIQNQIVFTILTLIFLISIAVKGITQAMIPAREE